VLRFGQVGLNAFACGDWIIITCKRGARVEMAERTGESLSGLGKAQLAPALYCTWFIHSWLCVCFAAL
jgi:hypothetical protein